MLSSAHTFCRYKLPKLKCDPTIIEILKPIHKWEEFPFYLKKIPFVFLKNTVIVYPLLFRRKRQMSLMVMNLEEKLFYFHQKCKISLLKL